jgi:ADP-ribose pyrophosphatase
MDDLNWKVLSSHYIVKDPWLTLRADRCQQPGGQIIEPCYVFEYGDWANVVALTAQQEVVLVRQYRHGLGRAILELPGGAINPEDKSPLAAARRELLEETGYTGEYFVATGQVSPNPASHTNMLHCFLATGVEKVTAPRLDATEQLSVELMPLTELVALAKQGGLAQSMQVSSLFFALAHLGRII